MRIVTLCIYLILFLSSSICYAQLISWNFSTKVSQKIGPIPEISIGDEIYGSITFASQSANIMPESLTEAEYRAIDNIRLNINNVKLISKNKDVGFNKILIRNNHTIGNTSIIEDAWLFGRDLHDPVKFVNDLTPIRITFFLLDKSAEVFDNLELPLQPLVTSDFTTSIGSIRFLNKDGFMAVIILNNIVFTPDVLAD